MNPWVILGIEPCDDPRAVKRAYAVKLKQNRPDDNPEAFQQLHSAYKQALKVAQTRARSRQTGEAPPESVVRPEPAVAEVALETVEAADAIEAAVISEPRAAVATEATSLQSNSEPAPEAEVGEAAAQAQSVELIANTCEEDTEADKEQAAEDAARQLRIDEYRRVLEVVDEVLRDPLTINREDRWHFLGTSPYMLEDEYNWNLGLAVFERFARFNQKAANRKGKYRTHVTENVLAYCDQLFGWSGNPRAYYQQFDEDLADTLFDALQLDSEERDPTSAIRGGSKLIRQKTKVVAEQLNYYFFGSVLGRSVAVILDILLVHLTIGVFATAIIMKVSGLSESDAGLYGALVSTGLYLIATWLAECSEWQTTPGKWLLGYRVTDKNFGRVGYWHGLWRSFSFLLTIPTYKIGWFINCFLGGNLMHDRLSRTHVINYRKSREEHLRRQG
ncbi:RDD family protein [Microbulbifer agarilyticus]|uniref:RDD family protein n=1 Tax=Microbulbifer agarilyticus TaxID=260552 RepID=UPI001C965156|nr:RDD family protein [Microbulbifer agarilyticus]MBY6189850.1 RDD family protein [Microbulbifer agarilyticus]